MAKKLKPRGRWREKKQEPKLVDVPEAWVAKYGEGKMLGHSQINITMDLYSHVHPTMQREAAAVMESIIQG